jgi:hypothetical protein
MSLINDALRRADMEQRARDAGGEPPPPPPLPPKEQETPATPKRRSRWKPVLGAVLLIGVGAVALGAWWGIGEIREKAGAAVETASAAFSQALGRGGEAAKPAEPTEAPTGAQAGPANDAPAAGAEPASPDQTPTDADTTPAAETPSDGESGSAPAEDTESEPATAPEDDADPVRLADAGTSQPAAASEDRAPTEPPQSPAAETVAVAKAAEAGTLPDGTVLDEKPLDLRLSADAAAEKAGGPDGDRAAMAGMFTRVLAALQMAARPPVAVPPGSRPTAGPKPAAASNESAATDNAASAEPKTEAEPPSLPPPPVDTSNLKISSIVSGADGGLAIINGRPVREGETVAGAKILRIRSRTVEVEINGRRATVGM